ncbi:MAG: hypothetical protein J5762_06080 [Clostridia bacterium]|nr:hypothetical protein [Clostridia bacterium]
MTVKIILCFLLVGATTIIGFKYSEKYRYAETVFNRLNAFNMRFKAEVALLCVTVRDAVTALSCEIPNVLQGADCIFFGGDFSCNDRKLCDEDRTLISDYINSLGISDGENQRKLLETYGELFSSRLIEIRRKSREFSILGLKLGFSAGLIAVVILI